MKLETYGKAYRDGYKRTSSYLRALGAGRTTADELAQAAWVKGLERIGYLRDERRVINWVNAIARNLFLTSFRRARLVDFSQMSREPAVAPSINVVEIDMRRGIQRCKSHERRMLEAQLDGYSKHEIAAQSGRTPAAAHAAAYRARLALRSQMHVPARQVRPDAGVSRKKAHRAVGAQLSKALGA